MSNTDRSPSILPPGPPVSLKVMALFFLFAGLLLSPDLLIYLGPMRNSLTYKNPLVRNTALMEVMVYRIVTISLSLSILGIILAWKRVIENPTVLRIATYKQLEAPKQKSLSTVFNVSFVVIIASLVLGLLYVVLVGQFLEPSIQRFIKREDGPIEQATAFLFLVCSILAAMISMKISGNRRKKIVYVLFSVFFFVCFGEEISWGQRIFNLETIGVIKDINVQDENNIHNLFGFTADRLFWGGVLLYGVVFPFLSRLHRFWHNLFDMIGLPLPSAGLAIGFLLASLVSRRTIYAVISPSVILQLAELRELLIALCFLLLMYECWLSMKIDRSCRVGLKDGLASIE